MSERRTVLLATDLLPRSEPAEARAVQLAAEWGAELRIALVNTPERERRPGAGPLPPDPAPIVERLARAYGASVEMAVSFLPGEDATEAIVAEAEARGAALIVCGAGSRRSLAQKVLGSTTERIVHRAAAPVLIARGPAAEPYARLAAATDFSRPAARAAEQASKLFPHLPLVLLHAYRVPFEGFISRSANEGEMEAEAARECRRFVSGLDLPPPARQALATRIVYGGPEEAICKYLAEAPNTLVAIGSHGKTGKLEALLGGTAERLLQALPADMVLVRARRERD